MSDSKITNITEVARTEKPVARILDSAVERSARKPRPSPYDLERLDHLFPPVVMQAVKEAGVPTLAQDQTVVGTYGWAAQDVIYSAFAEGVVFLGYSYLATLAQRAEYRVVTETIAGEMTREWVELKAASGDDSKHDKIKAVEDRLDALDVRNCFRKCAESDGFFGRGHLYLDTGMTDNSEELLSDLGDGRSVMSQTKIGPHKNQKLIGLQPVEATWAYPTHYESVDPLKRDWYSPTTWYVMSREIHKSRLLTFVSREVPDILKPAYAFGGLSMSQMLKPYVDNWLRTRQSVSDLIQNFSHNVLHTNMDATTAVGGDNIFARVALFNNIKNNQGTILVDKDAEDWSNVSVPLGGLDHLQAQAQEHMAAIARIPLVKLLGIQPAGLNASSEGELISFEDWIAASQELLFRRPLTSVIDFVQLSLWGSIDHDITFDFKPLRQLKPKEQAELDNQVAQTRELYLNMGAVDGQEVREAVAQDDDAPFAGIDLSQPLPQPPMGGPGGPEGPGGPPGGPKPNGAGGPPMQPPMGDVGSPTLPFGFGADAGIVRGFARDAGMFGRFGTGGSAALDAALLSHASVAFEHPAHGAHHCAQCGHYLGVDDCELVRPPVKPRDWCDRFTDADVEDGLTDDEDVDDEGDDLFAADAEGDWDPQEHPQSAKTGQFVKKGTSEAAAIPDPPQIKSQHASNIGKQKHMNALHAHAKAGEWDKVAAYPTPGINTYAKQVQKYKADLLKLAPAEGKAEPEAHKPMGVTPLFGKTLSKLGFEEAGSSPTTGNVLFIKPGGQSVLVKPPTAAGENATWEYLGSSGEKHTGSGLGNLQELVDPEKEAAAAPEQPTVPEFYKKDLGKLGFGFMNESATGSQLFQEPGTQISVLVKPASAESGIGQTGSGNATWQIFDKAGKVIDTGEGSANLQLAVPKHLDDAKAGKTEGKIEEKLGPGAKVTSVDITKKAHEKGFTVTGHGEMENATTGHKLKVDPGGSWTIKEKDGKTWSSGSNFETLTNALEWIDEDEPESKTAEPVVKPKGSSAIYSKEAATQWKSAPGAPIEPAIRYSTDDGTETLLVGTGPNNQGKWQINKMGEVLAKGSGQDELNAAFEGLHPRGPGGKFAKKSGEVEHWTESSPLPDELNGVAFKPFTPPADWNNVKGQKPDLVEPPMKIPPGKHASAGLLIQEPDGRVWIVKPKDAFAGYEYTFPKGSQDAGESLQVAAIREAFEESGLLGEITGLAGDYEGSQSMTRYYLAKRIDGTPTGFGPETEGVSLIPPEQLHQYLNTLRDKNIAETHFPPSSAGQPAKTPQQTIGTPLKLSDLKKVGGTLGTTPGGVHEDQDGNKFYVKEQDEHRAKNEVLAAALASAAGIPTFRYHLLEDGKGSASEMIPITKEGTAALNADDMKKVQNDFAVQAWLANWDAAGAGSEHPEMNQGILPNGQAITVDWGGALLYRGMQGLKGSAWNNDADEWESLRSDKNPTTKKLYGDMTYEQRKESADRLNKITDSAIRNLVDQHGPGSTSEKAQLAETLIKRREAIQAKVKAEAPKLKLSTADARKRSSSDAHDLRKEVAGWNPPKKPQAAISNYKGSGYEPINATLRFFDHAEIATDTSTEAQHIREMTDWLDKASSQEDMVVFRGIRKEVADRIKMVAKVGKDITDDGFLSMATYKTFSDNWHHGSGLTFTITVPKGSKVATVYGANQADSEYEILTQRGTKLRITKWEPKNNIFEVTLVSPEAQS